MLSLQGRELTTFPAEIINFQELKLIENWWEAYQLSKMDLSNNQIPEIPEEIAKQEVSVKRFFVSHNVYSTAP